MTFEPLINPLFSTTSLSFFTFLFSLAGMIFFLKTKTVSKHYRNIFSLLLFFAGMMSLGSALFSYQLGEKIGSVHIGPEKFTTAYGDVKFSNIKEIVLKKISKNESFMTPSVGADYKGRIIMVTKNGQFYYFSDSNYPVNEMIGPMRNAWQMATKKGASD